MKRRLTKFFTVLLTVMLVVGMAPATGSAAYAASWNSGSFSSWLSGLLGNSSSDSATEQNSNSNQQEDKEVLSNADNTLSVESDDNSGQNPLSLTKTITHNDGDNYTIKLETYSTGVVKDKPVLKDVSTDIVLVLDQSGSMVNEMSNSYTYTKVYSVSTNNTYYIQVDGAWKSVSYSRGFFGLGKGWYCDGSKVRPKTNESDTSDSTVQFYSRSKQTRLEALKEAVNTFVGQIEEKAKDSEATYRIAMVGFATGDEAKGEYSTYENTELFIGNNQYNYNDSSTTAQYSNAFQDMKTTSGKDNIESSIDLLAARGATNADLGMDMANKIFAANPISEGENRNRVVVMFTDGEPTKWSEFDKNVADGAIYNAYTSINTYKASVYTIGVLDGADPTADITNADNTNVNKYMHYVSSNFPNATNLDTPGTEGSILKGFYKKADDAEELKDVFKQISDNIQSGSSQVTLNTSSVLRDVISDDFSLPEGATADNILVKTAAYNGTKNGEIQWAKPVTFSDADVTIENGKTINVKNFDYQNEYIATVNGQNQGHKLIVEIPVTINRSFGGNNILSNASAGIYPTADALNATITAESPKGDHPTDYAVAGTEQWINEGETVTLESLIGYVTGDDSFEYKPDGIKNKYVDIVYTIKDKDGNTVGTYTVEHGNTTGTYSTTSTPALDVDTEYTIECKVTPISKATQDAIDSNRAATEKTYTATSYVYINSIDKAFVIDFGKPITYSAEDVFSKNQLAKKDEISIKDASDTYGKLTLNTDKSITYALKDFMNGIDTYVFNVSCKAPTQTVKMIPATSVYYEDNFGEDENGNNSIITYDDNWDVIEDGKVVTSINGEDPVGYDSAYEGNTKFSSGSAHVAKATDTAIKATFKFTGSGIDLYGYTDNNTGRMRIQLYKLNENDERISNTATYTAIVDTKYNSGKVYQTPLFSYMGEETCRYEAVVTVGKGSAIYLDAMRVYYPIGNTNENYTDDENAIKYVDIRDQIFAPQYFSVDGTLFVDEHADGHDTVVAHTIKLSDEAGKAEYSTYGRKREVAIAPGDSVTLSGFADNVSVKQIGMRTNSEAPEEFKITNPTGKVVVNGSEIALTSATDMYYNVTVKDGKLVITNNTNYIITLTNLKLK